MYSKKQRIISFLMAFLLIFTFAFINPLTTSKSYCAIPVLTVTAQRIITGVLISSGIVIKGVSDLTDTQKQDMVQDFANLIWSTMAISERLILTTLEIVDNIVNIPVNLYNSIKTKAQQLTVPTTYAPSLEEQGITIKYSSVPSTSTSYPSISFPYYEGTYIQGDYSYIRYEMSQAEPIFVYEGVSGATKFLYENVTTNIFDYGNGSDEVNTFGTDEYKTFLTPNLSPYNIKVYSNSNDLTASYMYLEYNPQTYFRLDLSYNSGTNTKMNSLFSNWADRYNFNLCETIFKLYFIKNSNSSKSGYILDIYDLEGNILKQEVYPEYYTDSTGVGYGMNKYIQNETSTTINPDMTFEVESDPAPVVTNTDATETILTLPSDLATSVGVTSIQVNVGSADVPDTPNTETIDNINTNVGELVTGGEIGEQVNTNIGTVEGLHGEITEQVDFGAVFDTISEYISALDISSVTWFPVAVASFLVPFLPVISLGLILFFIDRVLNGGA